MRCGNHGFAGGGIYFSRSAAGACRKYHNGRGNPDIIIDSGLAACDFRHRRHIGDFAGKVARCSGFVLLAGAFESWQTSQHPRGPHRAHHFSAQECSVQLGRTLEAGPHTVDRHDVLNRGFDSVKVIGVDVYAVYESRRVRVLSFRRVHCERAFSSMRALLCDDDQGGQFLNSGSMFESYVLVWEMRCLFLLDSCLPSP